MSIDPPTQYHIPKTCIGTRRPYVRPHRTDKTESDIEDIVIDGVARQRPHTIRYLCSFRRHLEPGVVYRYCTCGKSSDVLCDDTCDETDVAPLEFSVETNVRWTSLCACRFSSSVPFCDGSHALEPEVGRDEYAEMHGIDMEAEDMKLQQEWEAKCEKVHANCKDGECLLKSDSSQEEEPISEAEGSGAKVVKHNAETSNM